jgi:hypothetical protein
LARVVSRDCTRNCTHFELHQLLFELTGEAADQSTSMHEPT